MTAGTSKILRSGAVLAAAASLAGAGTALAAEPTLQGYGGQGGEVLPQVQQGGQVLAPQSQPTGDNFVLGDVQSGGNAPDTAVKGDTESGGAAPAAAQKPVARVVGNLPFTGFDVALIIGAGAGLLLLGFALRRMARPQPIA
jgi:hypothetical protein